MATFELLVTATCFVGVSSSLLLVNKLALKGMPLHSFLSVLQFACAVVTVLILKKLGMADADTFRWSIVRSYSLYVVLFCSSIYANMRAISSANLETVMVFRSFVPVFISTIEFAFMGRDAPNARSSCALVAISAGAASYVAVDRQFLVGGFSQYAWCFSYISIICVEISFARHILSSEDRLQSKWGPTLYTNALALFPMACAGFMAGEHTRLAAVHFDSPTVSGFVVLSCVLGTAMSYFAFRMTGMLSATSVSVFGVANKVFTIVLNFFALPDEHASPAGIASVVFCLVGAACYQQAPMREASIVDGKISTALPAAGVARSAVPLVGVAVVVGTLLSHAGRGAGGPLEPSPSVVAAASRKWRPSASLPTTCAFLATSDPDPMPVETAIRSIVSSSPAALSAGMCIALCAPAAVWQAVGPKLQGTGVQYLPGCDTVLQRRPVLDGLQRMKVKHPSLKSRYNFASFYAAEMLPANTARVIYLDTDVVVLSDLLELMQLPLGEKALAITYDCAQKFLRTYLAPGPLDPLLARHIPDSAAAALGPQTCTGNRGLVVMDIAAWQRANITATIEALLGAWIDSGGNLWHHGVSQPPFLLASANLAKELDPSWNVLGLGRNSMAVREHSSMLKRATSAQRSALDKYLPSSGKLPFMAVGSSSAKLLHYNGGFKPWRAHTWAHCGSPAGQGALCVSRHSNSVIEPCARRWWQQYNITAAPSALLRPPSECRKAKTRCSGKNGCLHKFDMLTVMRTPTCINHRTVMNALTYLKSKGLRKVWAIVPSKWVKGVSEWHPNVIAVREDEAVKGVSKPIIEALLVKYGFGNMKQQHFEGRASAGWYLSQFVNLGFVLRPDVLDTLLVHDGVCAPFPIPAHAHFYYLPSYVCTADQMILPEFTVHASGTFQHAGKVNPRFSVQVGGLISNHQYDRAFACLSGAKLKYHGKTSEEKHPSGKRTFPSASFSAAGEKMDYRKNWNLLKHASFVPHAQLGSFVTHSYVVFRPFMQQMLAEWAANLANPPPATTARPPMAATHPGLGSTSAVAWMEAAVACINPERPHLGFGESASYMTYVLNRYPEAHDLQKRRSWVRNPDDSEWSEIRTHDGFCCNLQGVLNRHRQKGEQFMGIELGHSYAGVKARCNYTAPEYFMSSAYPPDGHTYWASRGISFVRHLR
jgi:GDP-mannose transporter